MFRVFKFIRRITLNYGDVHCQIDLFLCVFLLINKRYKIIKERLSKSNNMYIVKYSH